jgi:mannosyltransferase
LRISTGFIGRVAPFFFVPRPQSPASADWAHLLILVFLLNRFRDIGYQHIPYFNCPNSPKCKGCVTGRFTDGEAWLNKEDCRPNWFKYVGMG